MHFNLVFKTLGLVLLFEAAAMVPSLLIGIFSREADLRPFLIGVSASGIVGLGLYLIPINNKNVGYREGFAIATLGWLLLAFFGAIPFKVAGAGCIDAFFESMSGFTTTGATIYTNLEILPKSLLFWRNFTQWLGGIGIIVLTLALIPSLNIGGFQMYKAEVTGPNKSKVLPRVAQTSRQLFKVYLAVTFAQILALKLAGLNWFDSFLHTFSSVSTGGFSNYNASVGHFQSPLVETIIIFFMIISGINFALHYHSINGDFKPLWQDRETRLYLGIVVISILIISLNLIATLDYNGIKSIRETSFQVASIVTTTGFATADYEQWPALSKLVLLLLMFCGGCAGSTVGGFKIGRLLILFKAFSRQLMLLIHPKAIIPVRVGKNVASQEIVDSVHTFFSLYILILIAGTAVIASLGFDLISAASASLTCLSNVGPGLGLVGPMSNFAGVPVLGKFILAILMLIGRLEIYTVLLVFSIKFWR